MTTPSDFDSPSVRLSSDGTRRGVATIDRYGADYVARRARAGMVAKALAADGLDPAKMKPADLAAYIKQVNMRAGVRMRAARALKRSLRLAEAEAVAEATQAAERAQNGGAS